MRKFLCLAAVGGSLLAADSAVDGPTLGYVNSAAGVRSVLGLMGAARLSAPVTGQLQGAAVLPGTSFAIAKNPEGALVRVNLKDGSIVSLGIGNLVDLAVSPGGGAVLARDGGRLHAIASATDARREFASPGAVRLMAISDEGTIALSVIEGDGQSLYVIGATGGARNVFNATLIRALAFVPASGDLAFADGEGIVYTLKQDLQLSQIGRVEGLTALAATSDGRVIAAAGRTVAALPVDGSPSISIRCACEATVARPLGQAKFLLTSGDDGPLWLLDAATSELRLAFVPEAVND